jgi:hypothetical protein
MGHPKYNFESRSARAFAMDYDSAPVDTIFVQNTLRKIHESMEPSKALLRESRDSENHPNTVPILIALDETGSMRLIPEYMVRFGLPKMVGNIIQKGVPDPAILFLGIGDHEYDSAPLQVGQFESGDEELDLWLTRTWLEGKGGSNAGESYLLAWYFAAYHTVTDAWEKRKQKGFLFTIGDEPCLPTLPKSVVKELMGKSSQSNFKAEELLAAAQEKYNVYHLHIMEGNSGHRSLGYWENLLNQYCVKVDDHEKVSDIIAEIVTSNVKNTISHKPTENVIVEDAEGLKDQKKDDIHFIR